MILLTKSNSKTFRAVPILSAHPLNLSHKLMTADFMNCQKLHDHFLFARLENHPIKIATQLWAQQEEEVWKIVWSIRCSTLMQLSLIFFQDHVHNIVQIFQRSLWAWLQKDLFWGWTGRSRDENRDSGPKMPRNDGRLVQDPLHEVHSVSGGLQQVHWQLHRRCGWQHHAGCVHQHFFNSSG